VRAEAIKGSQMTNYSRRRFVVGAASLGLLSACADDDFRRARSSDAASIDQRVDATLNFLYTTYPATTRLRDSSAGQLVMPVITKAGFFVGGAYGRGALRQAGRTLDYYSATSGTVGWQFGAQQYSHVLFFMDQDALDDFRFSDGWNVDARPTSPSSMPAATSRARRSTTPT
jgi:lipid-binding SYLF domain-containing protein